LKDIYKDFNFAGEDLVKRLQAFHDNGVYIMGSFIFGLPSDKPETFAATAEIAQRAKVAFAQFVPITVFPGTVDFERMERELGDSIKKVNGIPVSRRWLIPKAQRQEAYILNEHFTPDELRMRTQQVW